MISIVGKNVVINTPERYKVVCGEEIREGVITTYQEDVAPFHTAYAVDLFLKSGGEPVRLKMRESGNPLWDNKTDQRQGAINALSQIQAIMPCGDCCGGTPGAVIAVNAANCQNLFDPTWGLTQEQLTGCVIPGIDFCNPEFLAALTSGQLACIIPNCGPFTIRWNVGGTIIEVGVYPDPCGGEAVLSCDTLIDAVVVEGAGTEEANALYLPNGIVIGAKRYSIVPDGGISNANSIWRDALWLIYDAGENELYNATGSVDDNPWDLTWVVGPDGASPVPTVRQATIGDLCCTGGGPAEPCPIFFRLADEADNTLETGIVPNACSDPNLEVIAPNATVQLRDSAGNNIGSPDSYLSNSSNNKTAPDGSVQLQDTAGNNIGSPVAVRSNQTGVIVTAPDANIQVNSTPEDTVVSGGTLNVQLSDGVNPVVPVSVTPGVGVLDIVVPAGSAFDTIRIQFQPYANEARYDFTAADAGTYDNPTDDGGSGTVTWSINGGSFAAWPGATAFVSGNNIVVRRTTTTALGWVQIEQ